MFALADDLSGAAETAAALMSPSRPALITLSRAPSAAAPVVVLDLDSRHHPQAFDLVREALRQAHGHRRVFVKIDSLLRGNVAATVAACLDAPAVLVTALPSAGRTVVGGIPYVHGVRLRETRTWHAESRPAPDSVAEALGGVPSAHVPLAAVRTDALGAALAAAAGAGRVAVCDAETDADLDAIVAAALARDARLIGAGGLAAALGRALGDATPANATLGDATPANATPGDATPGDAGFAGAAPDREGFAGASGLRSSGSRLLIVVGTAAPGAAEQVRLLVEHGVRPVPMEAADPVTKVADRVRDALAAGPTALTVAGPAPPGLALTLGEVVRAALGETCPADLILTGGETARRVLDALNVRELIPLSQVHHGAVHSRTRRGDSVITRPGGFGDRDSLLRMAARLEPGLFTTARQGRLT
ncbi:four-carbon acid sugar kinase family protein [Nonomuraea cypriaca]|uniref:four-carbon acid sugar kinase family protein n=1 Tax=Nonomuraea cypriaca TaxID=1187855 RepID=UPI001A9C922D|nr:four-carbon acid sugar kinase family protein [Nonomuraea cypriaca]